MVEDSSQATRRAAAEYPIPSDDGLPPPVSVDLGQSVRSYWLDRLGQHTRDSYVGIHMSKCPEDLRVYEHLLWASRANVVVEIGAQFGGSALWFRDRLHTIAQYGRIAAPHVFSIDVNIAPATQQIAAVDPSYADSITLLEGDVRDVALPDTVAALIPNDARCFVVEDSAHTYGTTWAALTGFTRLVPLGGYFVVEDGCVDIDELRASEDWPYGVLPALRDWLASREGEKFAVRRDLECYGLSCHPHGFLQRIAAETA
jgi:cephalosporin hydroxylase